LSVGDEVDASHRGGEGGGGGDVYVEDEVGSVVDDIILGDGIRVVGHVENNAIEDRNGTKGHIIPIELDFGWTKPYGRIISDSSWSAF
jgi:hypothetical protein